MTEVAIVGGGIAGLAAAWELQQQGLQSVVFEASARVGGVILTERADGFVIEAGPDSLLAHKTAAVDLSRELGIADRLVATLEPRTAFVVRNGRLHPLPEASFLGLPTRIAPLLTSSLFSWPGKLRMAAEMWLPRQTGIADESIGDFVRRRFGSEARVYVAEPLLAGIHAGDVDRLSTQALFPALVHAELTHGSIVRALAKRRPANSSQGAFLSFPSGMGELIDALVAKLETSAVHYHTAAMDIRGSGPYTIRVQDGREFESRAVIVAIPAWAAAALTQAIDPDLASICRSISYTSSATVSFGLHRDQVAHPLDGSGFVVPATERRAVMAATWVSSKWPERARPGHVLIRGFVGGALDPEILSQTDAAIADATFADLADRLRITGQPLLTRVYRWPRASPQYHVGHLAKVRAIDDRLTRLPGLFVTGSAYRGTGIPDTIADARATAASAAAFVR